MRVLIAREPYRELCAYFLSIACHRRAEALAEELYALPYEPYAPVRKQLLKLLRLINAKRQAAGYSKIPPTCLRFKREIVRSFEQSAECPIMGIKQKRIPNYFFPSSNNTDV